MRQRAHTRSGERRSVGRVSLRVPERRTGFDRRRASPLCEALRDKTGLLLGLLVLLNVLNLADWGLTAYAMEFGAVEGNPLMASAFARGPEVAAVVKIATMTLVSFAIWRWRRYRAVLACAAAASGAYLALICYHMVGLSAMA